MLPCYFSVITSAFTKVAIFQTGKVAGGGGGGEGKDVKKNTLLGANKKSYHFFSLIPALMNTA